MDINKSLSLLWHKYKSNTYMPKFVHKRRYCYSLNQSQRDILVLGLNPSLVKTYKNKSIFFNIDKVFENITKSKPPDPYFKRFLDLLNAGNKKKKNLAYADLLYYRTKAQKRYFNYFTKHLDGILFLEDQLQISQEVIEKIIKPKVILATCWEVLLLLGLFQESNYTNWLGYDLKMVGYTSTNQRIYRIQGVVDDPCTSDIFLKHTNLIGTYVICYSELSINNKSEEYNTLAIKEIHNLINKKTLINHNI